MRGEADEAVTAGGPLAGRPSPADAELAVDPSLRRAVRGQAADRLEAKVKDAAKAFRRERFEEARAILRPLAEQAPTAESVRELLGLTYYRLGRWKLAVTELEAFRTLSGTHRAAPGARRLLPGPRAARQGRASCGRSCGPRRPSAALVAEGRIVYAGSLADQGTLDDAIAVLERRRSRRPQAPRSTTCGSRYALADLLRAGRRRAQGAAAVPHRRRADPELGDVERPAPRPALTARAARRCHTPGRTVTVPSPSTSAHPHRRRHPCPAHRPAPGTNLAVLVGTLSRPPEVRARCPRATSVLALEVTVRARGGAGRVRPGRLGRRPPTAAAAGPPATRSSSSAASGGASSGPGASPRAAPRWWRPRSRPHAAATAAAARRWHGPGLVAGQL